MLVFSMWFCVENRQHTLWFACPAGICAVCTSVCVGGGGGGGGQLCGLIVDNFMNASLHLEHVVLLVLY